MLLNNLLLSYMIIISMLFVCEYEFRAVETSSLESKSKSSSTRKNLFDDLEGWSLHGGMSDEQWSRTLKKLQRLENLQERLDIRETPTMRKLASLKKVEEIRNPDELWNENSTFPCMMYTEEQVDAMISAKLDLLRERNQSKRRQRKRRAIKNFARTAFLKWDKFPINYAFDGRHSSGEQDIVRNAFAAWQDNTCISFEEITENEINNLQDNAILITNQRTGCHSYVGRVGLYPQQLNLMYSCLWTKGIPMHEIGHSLGLIHTQQRTDRDSHITVHNDRVRDWRYLGQYYTDDNTETYDVPYDMGSVMHYSAYSAAAGRHPVIETLDPDYQNYMGQRVGLSFYDIKVINRAYCADVCTEDLPEPCQNEGYQDPKDCSKCRCPEGLSGRYCTEVATSRNTSPVTCGGDLKATTTHQFIESPGYATSAGAYEVNTECNWKITAPPRHRVVSWFQSDFGVYCTHREECRHWVELRGTENLGLNGPRYCCYNKPEVHQRSEGNSMLVVFRSEDNAHIDERRGFQLFYSAEFDPNMPFDEDDLEEEQTTTAAPVPVTEPPSPPFRWECDFESDDNKGTLCDMIQSNDDDFDWTLQTGATPSKKTGPEEADNGSYYVYIEASKPRKRGDKAVLMTSLLKTEGEHCLRFSYHMFGYHIQELEVEAIERVDDDSNVVFSGSQDPKSSPEGKTLLFKERGQIDQQWHHAQENIELNPNSQITFSGVVNGKYSGDIAIDNIEIVAGRC